jgi:hypothetical protein
MAVSRAEKVAQVTAGRSGAAVSPPRKIEYAASGRIAGRSRCKHRDWAVLAATGWVYRGRVANAVTGSCSSGRVVSAATGRFTGARSLTPRPGGSPEPDPPTQRLGR